MKPKTYFYTSGVIFFIVGSAHLWRLIYQWEMMVGNWAVPMWLSAVAFLLAYFLAYSALRLGK